MPMTSTEMIRLLLKNGFIQVKGGKGSHKKFFYKFLEIGNEFGYTKIYVKIINSVPIFLKNINLKKVDDLNYENTYLIDI